MEILTTLTDDENRNLCRLLDELNLAQTRIDSYAKLVQVSKRARAALINFITKCNTESQYELDWEDVEPLARAIESGIEEECADENLTILKEIAELITFKDCMEI